MACSHASGREVPPLLPSDCPCRHHHHLRTATPMTPPALPLSRDRRRHRGTSSPRPYRRHLIRLAPGRPPDGADPPLLSTGRHSSAAFLSPQLSTSKSPADHLSAICVLHDFVEARYKRRTQAPLPAQPQCTPPPSPTPRRFARVLGRRVSGASSRAGQDAVGAVTLDDDRSPRESRSAAALPRGIEPRPPGQRAFSPGKPSW